MTNFEVVIGIENHVELKTKSKMFAAGPVGYGATPNSQTFVNDLGYPGALPTVNKEGVRLALLACNALNMEIESLVQFDRKNYFYPDLAKGFQITQQFHPIGSEGKLEINLPNGETKIIEIERLHMEEDTAKQTHKEELTFIDYNRSGIGLIEIVTKPVMRSADEAVAYVDKLRETLLFLGVSDVKMNEGSLRCDVNISIRPIGYKGFGNKVEIKNLNSLNNVKKAIEFEINRQTKLILSGEVVDQETRRFDESKQETILMRTKSDAIDYKYFREPNIFPIQLSEEWIKEVIDNSPELAEIKRKRYQNELGLDIKEINYILTELEMTKFFEEALLLTNDAKKIANYLISDVQSLLNKESIQLSESKLKPSDIADLINLMDEGVISSKHAKTILPIVFETNESVSEVIERMNLKLISNKEEILKFLNPIIEKNINLIKEQYNDRPERVEKTIMGQLMKETQGNVNPDVAVTIINELIKENV